MKLVIRDTQLDAFDAALRKQLEDQIVERMRGAPLPPSLANELDPESSIRAIAAAAEQLASKIRARSDDSVMRLFDLMVQHGLRFYDAPELAWTSDALFDRDSPADGRVRLIHRLLCAPGTGVAEA